MSDFDRRRDIEAEGQRALMAPNKPDLSNMGKGTAYKIGYRQGQADAISAVKDLPEVRALVEAARYLEEAAWGYGSEFESSFHSTVHDKLSDALIPFALTEAKP